MRLRGVLLSGLFVLALVQGALASESQDAQDMREMRETIKRLQSRLDKMEAEKTNTVHKEELARMMKEILEDAKTQPALPKWMENLTFFGDLRIRYEHLSRGYRPAGWGSHTAKDRNRARFRLRFGFSKTWWDEQMKVVFRLTSAEFENANGAGHARSRNQTFTGNFSKKYIWIDLAYAQYKPKYIKGLTILGGKMECPVRTRTLMTWAADITPEGFAVDYEMPFFGDFKPYAQVGYWILRETAEGGDTDMWSYSAGFTWKLPQGSVPEGSKQPKDFTLFMGGTYYDFDHYNNDSAGGADGNWGMANNGNIVSQADMRLIELTSKFGWKMFELPFQVWGSWVHNCGDDYSVNRNLQPGRKKYEGEDNAFGVGLKVGQNKKKGDWSASYTYYHVELNSVSEVLTELNLGGPNNKGHIIEAIYNIDDFLTVGGRVYIHSPIHTIYGVNHGTDHTIRGQAEVIWKF